MIIISPVINLSLKSAVKLTVEENRNGRQGKREKEWNQVPARLLNARSATQRRGPGGAKRCVWHPRWLINRAASKLAPWRLRSYFLGNSWNIYTRRVAKTDRSSRTVQFVRTDYTRETTLKFLSVMIYTVTPAENCSRRMARFIPRGWPTFVRYYQFSWLIYRDENAINSPRVRERRVWELDLKYDTLLITFH